MISDLQRVGSAAQPPISYELGAPREHAIENVELAPDQSAPSLKNGAEYDPGPIAGAEAKAAVTGAGRMVRIAEEAVR